MTSDQWSAIARSRVTVPQHVVFRDLAQETVLLNIRSGQYHGIDHIGRRFFEAMREGPDLDAASRTLSEAFGQPVEVIQADLAAFCEQMTANGLVELQPAT